MATPTTGNGNPQNVTIDPMALMPPGAKAPASHPSRKEQANLMGDVASCMEDAAVAADAMARYATEVAQHLRRTKAEFIHNMQQMAGKLEK